MLFEGKVFKFEDNVDTDVIIPARYLITTDSRILSKHCMEDISENFAKEVNEGDIIVAGSNFGCGSSREQAVLALLGCGVKVILAESFARIFYRNCINRGLYVLELSRDILNDINEGEKISIDFDRGEITNLKTKKKYYFSNISNEMKDILEAGGIIEQTKVRLNKISDKGGIGVNGIREGALEGVRILDLTRVLAGPFSTMILADMGAEVIKIEIPNRGDDSRAFGPYVNGESMYYMNLNRNKKGITLNLKDPKGRVMFLDLVKSADVVVENYRPGTMEKLGLGYEDLKEVNEGIVYAAVSGFGHYGPYMSRPGYDIIGQAMGGLMSTTGWSDSGPTRTGTAMGDVLGGLSVTIGILAALKNKDVTGRGQKVDVSLVDSVVSSLEIITQIYLSEGRVPERIGNRYETIYPYDSFKAMDGDLVIGAGNEKLYRILCNVMGKPELATDENYNSIPKRKMNHKELKVIIEDWTGKKTVDEIVNELLKAGVPAAPIYNLKQVCEDPHISEAREMFVDVEHPVAGQTRLTGCHIKLYDTKPSIRTPAPLLGEHNEEIYTELLKMEKNEIHELKEKGVI